ncbi:MAG: GNAT family N-acetyltransferase, partial [Candidatus Binatia bacterium]
KTKEGEIRKEIAMAGNRRADYTGLICEPQFQDDAISAFATYLRRFNWDSLYLENILASNERISLFLKYFPTEYFNGKQVKLIDKRDNIDNYICPYVNLPTEWEDYLNTNLGSNTRYKIRRFLRKIDSSGEFRITHAKPETINNDIDILLRFWESKWRARKGEWSDTIIDFFRKILMHCFESGTLFLPILWKDETPLGAVASLIDTKNKSLLFYVGARDETVSNPPPGFVLHAYSIRYAINNGFKTYDFLRGNEPYKYLFGAKERHIRYIIVNARKRQNPAKDVESKSADSASLPVRSSAESRLIRYLLSPSPEERAGTHVLFLARHALDSSPERKAKYGYHVTYHAILLNAIRELGFKVTPASEYEVLFGPLNFDFLYAIHSHGKFDGHEFLASAIAAYRGIPCLGSSATTRAISEDKVLAKQVAASLGLDVAKHRIISPGLVDIDGFSLPGSWILNSPLTKWIFRYGATLYGPVWRLYDQDVVLHKLIPHFVNGLLSREEGSLQRRLQRWITSRTGAMCSKPFQIRPTMDAISLLKSLCPVSI